MDKNFVNPQVILLKQSADGRTLVLLVKRRDAGVWTLPGGRKKTGESLAAAAIRETKEETGCDVRLVRAQGIYHLPHLKPLGSTFVFVGEYVGGTPAPSEETSAVKWFDATRLSYLLPLFYKLRIQDALDGKIDVVAEQPERFRDLLCQYITTPWILVRVVKLYRRLKKDYVSTTARSGSKTARV